MVSKYLDLHLVSVMDYKIEPRVLWNKNLVII